MFKKFRYGLFLVFCTIALVMGCNLFDPFDSPGDDPEQLLSAARACLDRGDLTCAREYYQRLPSSYGEIEASESAFVELEEEGVGIGQFMVGLSKGDAGKAVTTLATRLIGNSGAKNRIYEAYKSVAQIRQNTALRGFTRFVVGLALAAAVLAEDGNLATQSLYTREDLVSDPSACLTAGSAGCAASSACDEPTGGVVVEGAAPSSPSLTEDAVGGTLPTDLSSYQGLGIVAGTVSAISHALTNELVAGGKFDTGTLDLANSITTFSSSAAQGRCFRWALIDNGFGEQ